MSNDVSILRLCCLNGHRPRFVKANGDFLGLCECGQPFGLQIIEAVDITTSHEFIDLVKLRKIETANEPH